MYKIQFYTNKQGKKPAREYIKDLLSKKDKDSRIKARRIQEYINHLAENGTFIGEPYVKHIEGNIWELRPDNERIFFVVWFKGTFVFLHHFTKKSQKTPKRELEKARTEYKDLLERGLVENDNG